MPKTTGGLKDELFFNCQSPESKRHPECTGRAYGEAPQTLCSLCTKGQKRNAPPLTDKASIYTQRQQEIIKLRAQGHDKAVIAEILGISLVTVKDHVKEIRKREQANVFLDIS